MKNQESYDPNNCQSLLGYARNVHERSGGICTFCEAGAGRAVDFHLWRQLTVEHIIGAAKGGYRSGIRDAVQTHFPGLSEKKLDGIANQILEANTLTACRFCNSATSRHPTETIDDLTEVAVANNPGTAESAVEAIKGRLDQIRKEKETKVCEKLRVVKKKFNEKIEPALRKHPKRQDGSA